jgi:hypothetical protein
VAFVIASCTQLEHWFAAMSSSIASFLRASKVNVDADGKIGPLLDYDLSFHKSGASTDLVNYKHVFGDNPQLPCTGHLPLELQRSPLTHPVRAHDPNRLCCVLCTGDMLATRSGMLFLKNNPEICLDLMFQAVLIEVVRVPVLMEWSASKGLINELPCLSDTPEKGPLLMLGMTCGEIDGSPEEIANNPFGRTR